MSSNEIEMEDLAQRHAQQTAAESSNEAPDGPEDNIISLWTWTAASILLSASLILLIAPRVLLFFSETSSAEDRRSLTSLESFLIIHGGVWLLATAVTLVLNIPSPVLEYEYNDSQTTSHPLLIPLTVASGISSFMAYNTRNVGSVATLTSIGAGIISSWGLWVIVFGSSSSISKTTGADKHTSSFIFKNKSSASQQKKAWKKTFGVGGGGRAD